MLAYLRNTTKQVSEEERRLIRAWQEGGSKRENRERALIAQERTLKLDRSMEAWAKMREEREDMLIRKEKYVDKLFLIVVDECVYDWQLALTVLQEMNAISFRSTEKDVRKKYISLYFK